MINQIKNPTFGGFKPDAMQRIAGTLGYTGDMSGFQQYLEQNPDKRTQMDQFKQAAMMMAKGGAVRKYQEGGRLRGRVMLPVALLALHLLQPLKTITLTQLRWRNTRPI